MQRIAFRDQVEIGHVEQQVATLDEILGRMALDAVGIDLDGDVGRHFMHHLADDHRLVAADGVLAGTELAVDVGRVEMVGIGELQVADTHPGKLHRQVGADAAASGNADSGVGQLFLGDPALLLVDAEETQRA